MVSNEEWNSFLEWLYKAHQLTRDCTPSRTSIELWKEYKNGLSNAESNAGDPGGIDKRQGLKRTSKKGSK